MDLMLWLFEMRTPETQTAIRYFKQIVEETDTQWEMAHPQKSEEPEEPEKPKNLETDPKKVFPVSPAETPKRGRPPKIDKELARTLLEKGLTQQQVADKLGCSRKTISRLVNEGMRQNSETKMGQNSNYVAPILSHPPVSFDKYI